jgi:hypothetical protein
MDSCNLDIPFTMGKLFAPFFAVKDALAGSADSRATESSGHGRLKI